LAARYNENYGPFEKALPVNTLRHNDVIVNKNHGTLDWDKIVIKALQKKEARKLTAEFPN